MIVQQVRVNLKTWKNLKTAIMEPCKKHLRAEKGKREKDWNNQRVIGAIVRKNNHEICK